MKISEQIKNIFHRIVGDKGLLLTIALSITFLFVFYGRLLQHPAITYFGKSDDGLQVYYQTLYHTRYDNEYWSQQSMNYPYGESIFFTSAMPMVNNIVKIFGPSAAASGVALINLIMLFSIPAGAIFIYLIFRHLRLSWFYASVCAVAIAFFSPQIVRMTGHYSLSWVFLIPAMIFLLLRFYDIPSMRKSWFIAGLSFLAATTHLYFFAFFAAMSGIFWLALLVSRDLKFGRLLFALKHFSIQVLLPFLLVQLLVLYSNPVADRTAVPWGYLVFHSNTTGVFYPTGQFYEPLFGKIAAPEPVESEGVAYVGLAAMLGLVVVIISQLYVIIKRRFRKIASVTDSKPLNIIFWTSLLLLYISFGHPFIGGNEEWLVYLGPLRQFRAVGRFAWVFFYVVNIVAVYQLYKISHGKKVMGHIVMILVALFLFTDMISSTLHLSPAEQMNNRIEVLEDEQNLLPANAWLRNFDAGKYQAILPLPYYHVGSENLLRLTSDREIVKQSYIVSIKTGLPLMSVSASRTSLSQTAKLISLVLDPSMPLAVLSELPDKRPLLLVVRDGALDENERRLVSLAEQVDESVEYKLYSLDPAAIANMITDQYANEKMQMDSLAKYQASHLPFMFSDSIRLPVYISYDDMSGKPFCGRAAMSRNFRDRQTIYDANFPGNAGNYMVTFWINNITGDVHPRTVVHMIVSDATSVKAPASQITNVAAATKMIIGNWGLVEIPVNIPSDKSHLQITMWNDDLRPDDVNEIDELLIIHSGTHVYRTAGDTIYHNNRRYIPPQ